MCKKADANQQMYTYGWLVGRLTCPFSTKIGYIGDQVLGGDFVCQEKDGQQYSNFLTSLPFCLATTHGKG